MSSRFHRFLVLLLVLTGTALAREVPVKVMSFNIRYGLADDGENSWPHRRDLVAETIRVAAPDLLGTQEVLKFQADFLREHLPGYGFAGVGRDDGEEKGEYTAVFYRLDRFERVDSGHLWLSETPTVPGSRSWDSSLPRMLIWIELRDRRGSRESFLFANTHFDHRGARARLESARIIRGWLEERRPARPVILTGDFNTPEGSDPYRVLVGPGGALIDSHRAVHERRSEREGTFSAFSDRREGARIDWILHSPAFATLNAFINHTRENGRNPSDHFPVEAVLRQR